MNESVYTEIGYGPYGMGAYNGNITEPTNFGWVCESTDPDAERLRYCVGWVLGHKNPPESSFVESLGWGQPDRGVE